jgi:hypothetical protein
MTIKLIRNGNRFPIYRFSSKTIIYIKEHLIKLNYGKKTYVDFSTKEWFKLSFY